MFIVGSPRSGTTWLQLLLAQHSEVVTGKETQLFTQYVDRLRERWHEELREASSGTTNGLTRVLAEAQFQDAIREFCDRVFDVLARSNPEASVLLEKSPEHSLHAETILQLYPEALFLHIIRDPRAVSNSFRHAARDWWTWAPSGPVETTRRWRKNVVAGRGIADLTSRYREVRYEDLIERGEQELLEIFEWLGLDADRAFSRSALAACEIDTLTANGDDTEHPWRLDTEPEGFFRSGRKDSWSEEMSATDIAIVEQEAGSLLEELGYEPTTTSARKASTARLRIHLHDRLAGLQHLLRELGRRVDWRLSQFVSRL